jgi:beta-mannosidase
LKGRYDYFNRDDSLFRSETGCPGAASMAALQRHRGDQPLSPAGDQNPYWLVPGAAWIPEKDVLREFGPIPDDARKLATIVKCSRYLQAESYRYAAEATRRKHPRCSGFIVWMGHDSMHCAANNSVIEIDASPKPAYDWLREAYARRSVTFKHDRIGYAGGQRLTGEVWVTHDDDLQPAEGTVTIEMRRMDGEVMESMTVGLRGQASNLLVTPLDWPVRACREGLFVLHLCWNVSGEQIRRDYLLSQSEEHPLAAMLRLPEAALEVGPDDRLPDGLVVTNTGDVSAVGVRLVSQTPDHALLVNANHLVLMPGELCRWRCARFCAVAADCRSDGDGNDPAGNADTHGRRITRLAIDCFNGPAGLPRFVGTLETVGTKENMRYSIRLGKT